MKVSWNDIAQKVIEKGYPTDKITIFPEDCAYAFEYYYPHPKQKIFIQRKEEVPSLIDTLSPESSRLWLVKLSGNATDTPGSKEYWVTFKLNRTFNQHSLEYVSLKPGIVSLSLFSMFTTTTTVKIMPGKNTK